MKNKPEKPHTATELRKDQERHNLREERELGSTIDNFQEKFLGPLLKIIRKRLKK